jgi:hypothetical protein
MFNHHLSIAFRGAPVGQDDRPAAFASLSCILRISKDSRNIP